jgi:NAD(P)H-dependent FMN reductase
MLNFALIVGSTRPSRFADIPANWTAAGAADRDEFKLDVLDLREQCLPFFNEPAAPLSTEGCFTEPQAEAWRLRLAAYDGFIATVAEYNHGPTAALKSAFDSAYSEWRQKPIAFAGYGGVGGARAIEQLRGVVIGLQMAPIKFEVNIAMVPYLGVACEGKTLDDYPYLVEARRVMFDHLVWWARALKGAREASQQ